LFERIGVFLFLFPEGLTARRSSVIACLQSNRPVVVSAPRSGDEFRHHDGFNDADRQRCAVLCAAIGAHRGDRRRLMAAAERKRRHPGDRWRRLVASDDDRDPRNSLGLEADTRGRIWESIVILRISCCARGPAAPTFAKSTFAKSRHWAASTFSSIIVRSTRYSASMASTLRTRCPCHALREGGYAEEFLRRLGAQETCSSMPPSTRRLSGARHEPAGPAELKGKFSAVIDGGTLEHIFNFPTAIRNCMEMLEVGGHFFSQTMANNFMGHGFYQFSPELFYRVFSPENGFRVHRAVLFESRVGKPTWHEAADPKDIGERVELINGRQTYLMLHAERVADVPIFLRAPAASGLQRAVVEEPAGALRHRGVAGPHPSMGKVSQRILFEVFTRLLYDLALAALVAGWPRAGFDADSMHRSRP